MTPGQAAGILFVTRKFAPRVGGMETLATTVWASLARDESGAPFRARLIANRQGNWWLPLWLPAALLRTLWTVLGDRSLVVLSGDAVVHAMLSPFLRTLGVRHGTMVMGLDLTWEPALYQAVIRRTLPNAECVVAISEATAAVARSVGVPAARTRVIRLAVPLPETSAADRDDAQRTLRARFAIPATHTILVSLSRLVPRKGVRWFVDAVLPGLDDTTFLVAGSGPEYAPIAAAIATHGLGTRCRLLGPVDARTRELLFQGADIFVQPNVPVAGDMEGFGLVAVEAAGRGALVVASDLEGLKDAVSHERTGILLPAGDAAAWHGTLARLQRDDGERRRLAAAYASACRELFDLGVMGREIRKLALLPVDPGVDRTARQTTPP